MPSPSKPDLPLPMVFDLRLTEEEIIFITHGVAAMCAISRAEPSVAMAPDGPHQALTVMNKTDLLAMHAVFKQLAGLTDPSRAIQLLFEDSDSDLSAEVRRTFANNMLRHQTFGKKMLALRAEFDDELAEALANHAARKEV